MKVRLIECRQPRELDVWLHSALQVAKALNPYLPSDDIAPVWTRIMGSACYAELTEFQRRWLALFQAVGARNARRMAELAAPLVASERPLLADAREYLLLAALAGSVASGDKAKALELWKKYGQGTRAARPPSGCSAATPTRRPAPKPSPPTPSAEPRSAWRRGVWNFLGAHTAIDRELGNSVDQRPSREARDTRFAHTSNAAAKRSSRAVWAPARNISRKRCGCASAKRT